MTRAAATLIGLASLAGVALFAVSFFAEVGFCAGALKGEVKGCLSAATLNAARSPVHLVGWPVAALGLMTAARFTPHRRRR
ncbi:MAG: hypothetical protein ABL957_16115 [Parvularculaceae bacterium]